MSKRDKLFIKFLSQPSDFTYKEAETLLSHLGYSKVTSGKTSGSAIAFYNAAVDDIIRLHKPHPTPHLKEYQLKYIKNSLEKKGLL